MAAAGFTHGGFYKHFRSKADLMAEAAGVGFSRAVGYLAGVDATQYIKEYLSRPHRDSRGDGCTLSALSGDAARQPEAIKKAFADGIEVQLATLARKDSALSESAKREARAKRIDTLAHVVGALVLSRACPDDSPLADEILEVCRTQILGLSSQKKCRTGRECSR